MLVDKLIFTGLSLLVLFTCLAFGAVEPWSVLILQAVTALLLFIWLLHIAFARRAEIRIPRIFWPMLAFTILGILQSVRRQSPIRAAGIVPVAPSLDQYATQGAVMLLCSLLVVVLISGRIFSSAGNLNLILILLSCYGLAMGLFGLIQHFGWNGRFYWIRAQELSNSIPFGPFANRNHFAGYMELLLPWPLIAILDRHRSREVKLFYASSAVWIGLAAVWTMSRGGMISILTQILVVISLSRYVSRTPSDDASSLTLRLRQYGAPVLIVMAIAIGTFWLGSEQITSRLSPARMSLPSGGIDDPQKNFSTSRGLFWTAAWEVFRAHPLTGAGLGSFPVAFRIFSPQSGPDPLVAQAHNDYLQILADTGIAGAACLAWFIGLLFLNWRRGLLSGSATVRATTLACCAACSGLMVHSIFDFNLQLPSHSLLFALLASIESPDNPEITTASLNYGGAFSTGLRQS